MRIMLMGMPGSDLRELAELYRSIYGLPLFFLDHICQKQDGTRQSLAIAKQVLAAELRNPDWILVGNYPALELEKRIRAADSVVLYAPTGLSRQLGFRQRLALRKDTRRMDTLFRALQNRDDDHIHLITDISQDPFDGAFAPKTSVHY